MVRVYKKKTSRLSWSDGQMHLAIKSVLEDGQSCKSVSSQFGVPRSTLQKRIKIISDDPSYNNENPPPIQVGGFSRTFNDEQEEALTRYITEMENMLIGPTSVDTRKLAFQFATKLGIRHNFNQKEGLAGKDWLRGFLNRHNLAIRKAEHTSAARAYGFNKEAVKDFFTLLKEIYDKHHFTPDRIYNVDETGISVVPKSSPRVIARKGKRQVGGKTVAERGETVTAEICMSAAGLFMPPMLIFPRVRVNEKLLEGAPPGAWAEFHKTGYMQTDIFARWFEKFIQFSQATPENPVLLLLDGHVSHVKNMKVIDLARENGVVILSFPPHCTHKMQPLDVGFMAPLNSCFGKEISTLQQQNIVVNMQNLYSIFGKAFLKAAKMETAVNSFRKCGLWPYNADVFTESDFAASKRDCSFSSSTSSTSNTPESEARISQYVEVLKQIHLKSSPQSSFNKNTNSCTENMQEEGVVRIPLAHLLQAKPLFDYLNPYFYSKTGYVPPQEQELNKNDVQVEAPLSAVSQTPKHYSQMSLPQTPQVTPAKKGRAKGKAAVITEDNYRENLLLEKNKKHKKREGG